MSDNNFSRATKIGIGLGATTFFLLWLLAVALIIRDRRKAWAKTRDQTTTVPRNRSQWPELIRVLPAQESAKMSSLDLRKELPDSGGAKRDIIARPSNSRAQVSEPMLPTTHKLPDYLARHAYEVMNRRELDGRVVLHTQGAKKGPGVLISPNISSQMGIGQGAPIECPCVKTIISTQSANGADVDRSLPSTPISESVQTSPLVASFGQNLRTCEATQILPQRSAILGPWPNAWQRSFGSLRHLSYSSMDMEIVVPPGLSELEVVQPLKIYKKDAKGRSNLF